MTFTQVFVTEPILALENHDSPGAMTHCYKYCGCTQDLHRRDVNAGESAPVEVLIMKKIFVLLACVVAGVPAWAQDQVSKAEPLDRQQQDEQRRIELRNAIQEQRQAKDPGASRHLSSEQRAELRQQLREQAPPLRRGGRP
ncbi:hypothetical protein [Variovorax terrae]|uniref:Uncharacterized protein n=1 Tax=Variovorax terrae TaxID=2923278 RepID=A0A9X2AM72_9BURK|nr:hypothetical protein [Variovorax terrae]MCJ0762994.1 hypothetical protein [Variovorax terrae]